CRHDDEDVHVAVLVGRAVGVGAEQDDLLRMELLRHVTRVPADHSHGNVRPAVPARGFGLRSLSACFGHALIIPAMTKLESPATSEMIPNGGANSRKGIAAALRRQLLPAGPGGARPGWLVPGRAGGRRYLPSPPGRAPWRRPFAAAPRRGRIAR